ncbi:MAG: VCBS repeat-containing protein [Planctomycetes bacterium]|nr:VCBS repeat-containing protein [Planctomycetota bacterium]
MRFLAALSSVALAGCGEPEVPVLTRHQLPPRAAVAGTLFARLDSAQTGLTFSNELRRENVVAYVYTGSGVAVGDYDADGMPDVYLVSQDGPNKLFRQVAPLRFVDVTAAAGGLDGGDAWGSAATFADVDGDGDLDLYVCNLESPNLLYLNQGDGTFREGAGRRGLAAIATSTGAAFADYDNDGDLDLYLLTNRMLMPQLPDEIVAEVTLPADIKRSKKELFPPYPSEFPRVDGKLVVPPGYEDFCFVQGEHIFLAGQCDRLYRNDAGIFRDVTADAGIHDQGNGLGVVWWDFDDDGRLDLYVANDLQSPDKLYHNLGDGTFADVTGDMLPCTAFFGMGCDFGDLDRDGRLDLMVADMSSTTHYMSKMLMGNMDQHRWFLMNSSPPQLMRNVLYHNTGTGRFAEAARMAHLASTDWTWSVRFADFDEDGWLDCHVTNGIPVFTDDPDAGRAFKSLWDRGQQQQALDLYRKLPRVVERNIARRNLGGLDFEDVGATWGLDEESVGQGAVVADLDRDGDLDILVNNQNGEASLFENRSSGTHRILVELRGTVSNERGVGARITVVAGGGTQTRLVMPTRGYMSAGEAIEHFGLGAADRLDELSVRWPSGIVQVFHDVAADQHLTIREQGAKAAAAPSAVPRPLFEARSQPTFMHREREFDDFAAQPLLPHRLSRLGPGLAAADVDGDGHDDVWIGGAAGQAGSLQFGGGAAFTAIEGPWRGDAECEDLGAEFFDADGDGDLDLYVVSGGIEAGERTELLRDRLYRNDGERRFVRDDAALPDLRHSGSCVAAGDFDGDGDQDLFVGSRVEPGRFPHAPTSVLLRNDGGRFVDVTATLLPALVDAGMVTDACWADLDGDGHLDLVIAAQWQPVRVFGNKGGAGFEDRTAALGLDGIRGQWNGIAVADLDADGDLDLVVTNLGLNTKYKADPEHALQLFARDFDGNGTFDVVEAKSAGGRQLPVRGLSCSSSAMPHLAEKFKTYDAFARATLGEIYGEALDGCLALSVNELRHVVFENRDGRFVPHPLPRATQISVAHGIGVADFDGDGHLDLVLAQNSHAPEPETGPNAGGLGAFVRGDGRLGFTAIGADRSGIVMPEDGVDIAVLDLDGDGRPDFLCSTNAGPLRAFVARSGSR